MTDEVVETAVVQIEADITAFAKDMSAAQKEADMLGDKVSRAMQKALMGSADLETVFKNLALDISRSAFSAGISPLKDLVSGSVSNVVSGLFSALGLSASGSSSLFGSIFPFANGGVVAGTTLFPMQSGLGMMGEAGPEAIMPLQRGSDGRLGVATSGNGARPVSIVMNVTTPDAASFAKSENQIATKLARAVGRGRRGL
ncbi:phage tail tape measure protein, lambda family [Cohaesibacter sp. ES.047]|uniref:phage tail tape measure protein n=1 Tax=Cohaesibacter sp. ES.047 TaxID=1798205 RepID=UPI000BB99144|nr:phage tail tape measure protein [Cohaesibacter sp. ES.047]SNY92804.1 phage tail tape measure protein, lambda family [Cohaesibacter sp. ES.047]